VVEFEVEGVSGVVGADAEEAVAAVVYERAEAGEVPVEDIGGGATFVWICWSAWRSWGVAEDGGGVDEWVFVKAGIGLVLTGGPFDGVAGNGFLVNIERIYIGYGPGPLKSFLTIDSNLLNVLASTVNSHSK